MILCPIIGYQSAWTITALEIHICSHFVFCILRLTSDDLDPKDDYKQALGNYRTKLMIEENRNEELEAENAQLKLELEQVHLIRFSSN